VRKIYHSLIAGSSFATTSVYHIGLEESSGDHSIAEIITARQYTNSQ